MMEESPVTVPAAPPAVEPFDAVDVIAAKRDGAALTDAQIDWVVDAYTRAPSPTSR